jgi:sugar phosphate isomerase/epimerase
MQIALYGSIAWRHPFGFAQVIDWAGQFGWDLVDARGLSLDIPGDETKRLGAFGYDMLGPRQVRPSARVDLRRRLEVAGLQLLCIYCSAPVNLSGTVGEESRGLFCEFLQLAADVGCPWVRAINNTTSSDTGPDMSPQEAFDRTVAGIQELAARAADLGVGIMLENNENTTTSNAEELRTMQDAIGDVCRTGIAYDPVNAYFQGHDPAAGFETLQDRITVVHLKNVRRHEAADFQYVPRGSFSYEWTSLAEGDLDWRNLLQLARTSGFDGPLTFEYVNPFKGMPPEYWNCLREPEQAAEEEARFLRRIISEL